jgi:hypothetical protein
MAMRVSAGPTTTDVFASALAQVRIHKVAVKFALSEHSSQLRTHASIDLDDSRQNVWMLHIGEVLKQRCRHGQSGHALHRHRLLGQRCHQGWRQKVAVHAQLPL